MALIGLARRLLSLLSLSTQPRRAFRFGVGGVVLLALAFAAPFARAQTWTTIPISFYPGTMVLMTDGTVLVHYVNEVGSSLYPSGIWERLTPDAYGNYADGTWSQLPTMPGTYAPEFHATAVLPDGRLLVEGGEYNGESNTQVEENLGAIYDPVANTWTSVNPPSAFTTIGDAESTVLPDGVLMLGNCCTSEGALLNASSLTWTLTGFNKQDSESEENWALLPNGEVLTVDLWASDGTTSELYNPSTGDWSPSGTIPAPLEYSACHETGPMVLRPDGTVTAIGGNGQLATYDSSTGTWTAGPLVDNGLLGEDDGPAVLLPDGNVFFEVAPTSASDCYGVGSVFYEWNGSTLTQEPEPPDAAGDSATFDGRMLVLPTGQVLYAAAYEQENGSEDKNLFLYTPSGTYQAAWQPTVTSVATTLYTGTADNSITGTQFNGLSQGSMYGDDEQSAENFPLVYLKNIASGEVFYCRTHGFSTMAVATGSAQTSAEFDIPANVPPGEADLVVVVNGIPSDPVEIDVEYGPQPTLTVSPTDLNIAAFGAGTGEGTATLTNDGPESLGADGVTIEGQGFSLPNPGECVGVVAPNGSCLITVDYSPGSFCVGTVYGSLYFNDSAGQQTVTLVGTQKACTP